MKLLVNTLSIGSMSGHHVVYGFLRPYAKATAGQHELVILHYEGSAPPDDILAIGATTVAIPDNLRGWAKRTIWETTKLPGIVRQQSADIVLTVSGALTPRCPVPQAVLCQNPWCYVPEVHENWSQRFKAKLQRIGYGSALRKAATMFYISGHLRDLYRNDNQGSKESPSEIVYVGLNQDTFETAQSMLDAVRDPMTIVSVSAMASWKGAHTLVDAVAILRKRDVPAKLNLVGPWPNSDYEQEIRQQIQNLGLQEAVSILGRVSDEELHRQYATSRVFCLMSTCESFGIPAAEAMAFGTPVVSTNCCAISEICAPAGQFGPANDPEWTANALQTALQDQQKWNAWSEAARERASILNWEQCAQPLQKIPQLVENLPT